ncbi:MAG: prepilin-type N-terminal cleavage/methylation domain-containing protein [Bacillati bacterium ANGP1]|uniref:Prepilin-type N-terminal cleavage/methylation domain-containing protein n=1 Tax=Candidatus Segetimicrobium genomatis TaxID=2569760 RepID=A0A537LJR6_9BACT|nr:MAG: prepilin-type N-terminal cleavage/methylation domain-containing protein [Terrabacteria group bacterium ANGP1]
MTPRRSLPAFSNRRPAGFSLTEVLVALSITSIVVLAVGSAFVFVVRGWTDSDARLAAQQNLRTGVEEFYREVRPTSSLWTGPTVAWPARIPLPCRATPSAPSRRSSPSTPATRVPRSPWTMWITFRRGCMRTSIRPTAFLPAASLSWS